MNKIERLEIKLRIPATLKLRLCEEASANGRSLNAEIVQRLRASLNNYSR
jgi:predicted HicB family RNase H-like nuclease